MSPLIAYVSTRTTGHPILRNLEDVAHLVSNNQQEENKIMKSIMASLAESYQQDYMQQGIQQGMQQGRQEERAQIAQNMLHQLHLSPEVVAKTTGLPQEEVTKLSK